MLAASLISNFLLVFATLVHADSGRYKRAGSYNADSYLKAVRAAETSTKLPTITSYYEFKGKSVVNLTPIDLYLAVDDEVSCSNRERSLDVGFTITKVCGVSQGLPLTLDSTYAGKCFYPGPSHNLDSLGLRFVETSEYPLDGTSIIMFDPATAETNLTARQDDNSVVDPEGYGDYFGNVPWALVESADCFAS